MHAIISGEYEGLIFLRLTSTEVKVVQLKYFGDSRDYFKYDLITHLLKSDDLKKYAFIPMLTNHRVDSEGNKKAKFTIGKSTELLSFIESCHTKDLNHWEIWLKPKVHVYKTIHPVNETNFRDDSRQKYWQHFSEILKEENALVFVDPDTGLESGTPSYLRKMGREKYILNDELAYIFEGLAESSVLMIYQHLPNNKHIHKESVSKKINQAKLSTNKAFVSAYREDDLAFIFMGKNEEIFESLNTQLHSYHEKSGHKYKSIHVLV